MHALAVSLTSDVHAAPPEYQSSAEDRIEYEYDVDLAMGDMDSMTDWIGGDCMHKSRVDTVGLMNWPHLIPARIASASLCELMHVVMTERDAQRVMMARDEIANRWLQERGLA